MSKEKKIKTKQKNELRPDIDNFEINYLRKKKYLDKYCNKEIIFHRQLLKTKSVECEVTKEPIEYVPKVIKRDAEFFFNKIFEICKSSLNKRNMNFYDTKRLEDLYKEENIAYNNSQRNSKKSEYEKENKNNILSKNENIIKELDSKCELISKKQHEIEIIKNELHNL